MSSEIVRVGGDFIKFPTSGGTPASITYNEETSLSTTLSGAIAVGSQTIQIHRFQSLVFLTLPAWSTGSATASAAQVTDTALATRFRPSSDVYFIYGGTNLTESLMLGRVGSNGVITWFGGGTATSTYTTLVSAAAKRRCVSYSIL